MKPLNGILVGMLVLATAAILAAPSLAQPTAASFKKTTPDQKRQLNTIQKAPRIDDSALARERCLRSYVLALTAHDEAVIECESLYSPAPGSPIYVYNQATPSQQFATCQGFADEFACFAGKLIRDQRSWCGYAKHGMLLAAQMALSSCLSDIPKPEATKIK
jgi:hypothetical protein